MTRILLVYTNRNRSFSPPPIGLAYLIPPLKEQGHDVRLLDMMFSKHPEKDLINFLETFKPEIAGFSIRNLDNQYMLDIKTPLPEIKKYVSITKDKGVITVLGGTAFTTLPKDMLKFMNADYGISGQGEDALPQLVKAIEENSSVTGIPGIVYWNGGNVSINGTVISGYAGSGKADWNAIDVKLCKRKSFITPPASVIIKTGCPYKCSFCDAKTSMGSSFIFRNIEDILSDLRSIIKMYNVRWFFFIDPCFNAGLKVTKELLRRIIEEDLKIRFVARLDPIHGCFDDELFSLYSKAGGYFIWLEVDSFSDKILQDYNKPFSLQDIYEFGRLANKHGIKFGVELLFGGPAETEDTIRESMAFLPKIEYSLFSYAVGIRVYPNTALYETAAGEGCVKGEENLLFPKFYVSENIDAAWAKAYIDKSVNRYSFRSSKMLPVFLRNMLARYNI